MRVLTSFAISAAFLTVICNGDAKTHHATISSSSKVGDIITRLPNDGNTEYRLNSRIGDILADRIFVTRDGRLVARTWLRDLGGTSSSIGITCSNVNTGAKYSLTLSLRVTDEMHTFPAAGDIRYHAHHRVRRAASVPITKTVPETVAEIALDYASAGVVVNNARYYLLNNDGGVPFTGADPITGKLIVNMNHRLDYETAPSHRYQLEVFVNYTGINREYNVSVTITLTDVNDEAPVFTMQPKPYLAIVDASRPPNSKVSYVVTVSDTDAGSQLVYTLEEGHGKFRVTQDGELYTTDRLLEGSEYRLVVKVEDIKAEQNSQTATAKILILAGRRPPQFYEPSYRASIPENMPRAYLNLVIKGKSFQGDAISFTMPESQVFMIVESPSRQNEARIRTTRKLNYETDDLTYVLTITAKERGTGLSSTAKLTVTLTDLNDNSPRFDISEYVTGETFSEDTKDGTVITTVKATDEDPADSANGKITYSLKSDSNVPLPFSVQTREDSTKAGYKGVITVSGKLDYDTIDKTGYRFKVIATDSGNPTKSSSAYVRVRVVNTNDEAPNFESAKLERIESTKSVNSVVTTVLASDPDGDKVTYAITSTQPSPAPFGIDSSTGSISLTQSLKSDEFKDLSSFTLNVSATDDGSCCRQLGTPKKYNVGFVLVIIEIVGRNHAPEFPDCAQYSDIAKAPENTADAFVIQVNATDEDVGPNGEIKYSLIVNEVRLFKIDKVTGEIRTSVTSIDREATSQITVTVKAEDGAQSKLSTFCTFTMTVEDLNDNDPSLSLPPAQDASIDSPPGTTILSLFGVDPDLSHNGTSGLTYKVIGNSNFHIAGQSLKNNVTLSSSLNPTQTMVIVVTDGGGRSKREDFKVRIVQTANPPIFNPIKDLVILENLTDDTIIARIKAVSATGGPVNYYLVPTTTLDAFYMLTDNKECNDNNELCLAIYKSQKLDADELRFYKLRVRVTPQSSDSNAVAETTINVKLNDVNDNIPVFENIDDNGYIIGSVDENSTVVNTRVATVKANDSDITPEFKTKTYSLVQEENSDLFSIEPTTGVIRVKKDVKFDRESTAWYRIQVKAIDGAPSSRPNSGYLLPNSRVAKVQVNINDINDNPPYFPKKQYEGIVEETASKGTQVINIRANDVDIENNFQYIFLSGNDNQAFEITDTGNLLVFDSGRLDYETKQTYNMVVEVSDGRFQATTNVQIRLTDMNDNVPEFTSRVYNVYNVTEEDPTVSSSNRYPIIRVNATDADVDRTTKIQYALSGSYSDRFQIDADTGQVYLVKPLDRDSNAQWDVNVLAHDEPNTPTNRIGYAIISVFPKDINDNNPVFVEETLTAKVYENGEKGELILTISATDKDEGNNGLVKFRLRALSTRPKDFPRSDYPFFSIAETGVVRTLTAFNREVVDRYTFEVIADDQGTPGSNSATGTVTITIGDVNDNKPRFVPGSYERQVSELAGPLSFILRVLVQDLDSDATFAYQLDEQARMNFTIDDQGNINIRDQQRLDFEHFYEKNLQPYMNLTVTVNDGKFSDTAYVHIKVVDENDETPQFDPVTVSVSILESVAIGQLVHKFAATDRDANITPENSEIEYLIDRTNSSDSDRYFKIDAENGEVRTQKSLDRERVPVHNVKILAVDKGYPRRTGTATLIVTLDDVNDSGPRLVDPIVYIAENMPVNSNTRPREIKAVDDDDNKVGHGPPFKMLPTNGSEKNDYFKFIFHKDWDIPQGLTVANGAGELLTTRVLNREGGQGAEIDFYLDLFDKQDVHNVRLLKVVVADEDDNPPFPGHRDALIYNYKAWEREFQIVQIGDCYAEDKDDWDKPYKSFEEVGEWREGFSIDGETGMISANLAVIPSGVYEFRCRVIDNYIKVPACALECNVAGGTLSQVEACKDKCRVKAEAVSTVKATIKTIEEQAVWSGASIRLKGTALEFVQPRSDGRSPYDIFITEMAKSLRTKPEYVDVFSVLDANTKGYVDVRFTAHGSPYYNSTKLIGTVLDSSGLSKALGITVAQVPVNECLKEICEGGCTNALHITSKPALVNANGSSLVGITSFVRAKCGCDIDSGLSPLFCTPESCLHGGVCVYNKDSQTTSCKCPKLFDGPRCQQVRHSFTGSGWAQYRTLPQCGNGTTSIEFITTQSNGILLYNGPSRDPGSGPDAITDYIAIGVADGKPVAFVNYGTGHVMLTVNEDVSDGVWHKLELTKVDRLVTLTLDNCVGANIPEVDTSDVTATRGRCQDTKTTPGENRFLNVATLLELGGRAEGGNSWWPSEIATGIRKSYDGCVRNLLHNGKLYDLHIGNGGRQSNSQDGCPREDKICLDSNGSPVCGVNGICEAQLSGTPTCRCKPGWRGSSCNTATSFMDFSPNSYVEWEWMSPCQGSPSCPEESYSTDISLSFRSRDKDKYGLLFYVMGKGGTEYIKLMIVSGKLQLRYDIGSDSIDITKSEQIVTLPVTVTDGALHYVLITRVGKRFTLQMDGGEGRYYAMHEDINSHQLFNMDGKFFTGADLTGDSNVTEADLENSCITDVRFNGKLFPTNDAENADSGVVKFLRRKNVVDGCTSDGCVDVTCPGIQNCVDLWRDFDCRCPGGYLSLYAEPFCEDINECFPDSPCLNGRCDNIPGAFKCDCHVDPDTRKRYIGELCNALPVTSKLSVGTIGIFAPIIAILFVAVIAVGIFCYITRRSNIEKGEVLIDPYSDICETIYNYDEEGMPEEDQDGYDISRLSKPVHQPIQPISEKPLGQAPPSRPNHPPDVGDFINGRLNDADDDPTNTQGDELKDYMYEGNGSDAGTLSSLNSCSSGGDQDFGYLNDWGPKFARLADMYGNEEDA